MYLVKACKGDWFCGGIGACGGGLFCVGIGTLGDTGKGCWT